MSLGVTLRRGSRCARAIVLLGTVIAGFGPAAHGQPAQHDIVLMLDNSGSMRSNDPEFLTSVAVRAFIEGLGDEYRLAIVSFDQNVEVLSPLVALDEAHRATLLGALRSIDYQGLLTNSPAALERSIYELRTNGRAGARKSIIFMTDGIVDLAPEGADAGDVEKARWMKSTLADEAADSSVRVFGIAFTDNADFELIQTLARITKGEYYRAYRAADIDGVFASIRAQLAQPFPVADAAAPGMAIGDIAGAVTADTAAATTNEAERLAQAPQAAAAIANAITEQPLRPDFGGEPPTLSPAAANVAGEGPALAQSTPIDPPAPLAAATGLTADHASERATGNIDDRSAPLPGRESTALDESKIYLLLMIGAAAIVLALAALILVLLRRKPAAAALSDALMPRAYLHDVAGRTSHARYELGTRPTVIGRFEGADREAADYIVIDETTIGRRHALIEYKDHSFWVTDQNSLNGTYVNNERVETGVRLKHGDRIRFYKSEFEFLVLEMLQSDQTMMSDTMFADTSASTSDDEHDTPIGVGNKAENPAALDPTRM